MMPEFLCTTCGKVHSGIPHYGTHRPDYWRDELENDPSSLLTTDLCIVEGRDFFIRGVIEIPVFDHEEKFGWGVWITQKKENFEIYRDRPDASDIGPFFGWLSTHLPYYMETTVNLQTRAHFQGGNLRPLIELRECDHELYFHQRDGITIEEAWRIIHACEEASDREEPNG